MEGMDKETFEFKFGNELTYTTVLSDQRMVDLIPGGARTIVRYEDRLDFIRLVQKARLEESKEQVMAFGQLIIFCFPGIHYPPVSACLFYCVLLSWVIFVAEFPKAQ